MLGGLPAGVVASAAGDLGYVVWFLVVGSVLIVLSLVFFLLMNRLRRRALEDETESGPAFTMEGLDQMRRGGQLTDEEYRRLRRQVLGIDPGDADGGSSSSRPAGDDDGQTDRRTFTNGESEEQ